MKLYPDHLVDDEPYTQLDRVRDMVERDHRPEVLESHTVESSDPERGAYLIQKIRVLDRPFEQADVVADRVDTYVCSCSDFYFNQSDGVETGDRAPSEMGTCKHVRSEIREVKANEDEQQETL